MIVKTVNYHSSNAGADLAESLRKTGFAVLVNHPVTPQRIEDIYASWTAFLPMNPSMTGFVIRNGRMGFSHSSLRTPRVRWPRI